MEILPGEIICAIGSNLDVSSTFRFAATCVKIYATMRGLYAHKWRFYTTLKAIKRRYVHIINITKDKGDIGEDCKISIHSSCAHPVVYWRIQDSHVICIGSKCTKILGIQSMKSYDIFLYIAYSMVLRINGVRHGLEQFKNVYNYEKILYFILKNVHVYYSRIYLRMGCSTTLYANNIDVYLGNNNRLLDTNLNLI
jgi:hypothetical protein